MTIASGTVSRIERRRASAACKAVSIANVEVWSIAAMMSGNKYRRTLQAAVAQVGQCLVCPLERVDGRRCRHTTLAGNLKKFAGVAARQVGDRQEMPLLPQ